MKRLGTPKFKGFDVRRGIFRGWGLGIIFLVILVFYPFVDSDLTRITAAANAGIFIMMALGLNIVVGFAGLLDLGYAAFFAIGAYTYALVDAGAISVHGHTLSISFWPMLIIGAIVAAFFGAVLGAPTLRLRGDYLAIVTLGFGEIVPLVFRNTAALGSVNGFTGLDVPSAITILWIGSIEFNVIDPVPFYYLILILGLLVVLAVVFLRDSRIGRAWVAMREDEIAAACSGINLVRTKLLAYAMGASLSGIAGVYYAAKLTTVTPDQFDFTVSIYILVMVVLGGMGSIPGVIAGAGVIYFINNYFLPQLNHWVQSTPALTHTILANVDFTQIRNLLYGIILVAMMILRPEGLIPSGRRRRELHGEGVAIESLSVVGEVAAEVEVPAGSETSVGGVADGDLAAGTESRE